MYETIMWMIEKGQTEKIENIIALFPTACPAPHLFPFFVQRMFASKEEGDLREITKLSYDFDSSIADLMEYMDELPKDTVLDVLEKTSVFSGIDKLRQSDDLYNFIMPGILCDSKLCLHYRPKNRGPVPMPVISMYGDSDTTMGYKDVHSWHHYTFHEYKLFDIEGDHFFVNAPASKLKTMHLVADHMVGLFDQFTKEKATQQQATRIQNQMATTYESATLLSESTPIVLLVSPGMSAEDVVQIRQFMSWTSRGIYTLHGSKGKPVEELAAEYLFQVLTMKLTGPFIVIGWSAGAVVAYDLAVKLEQQAFFVDKVVMMDGLHPVQMRDFGRCAACPYEEKAEFVMQRVLQRHYMWPRFAKTWPDMTHDERMDEFLQIYSAIIGRDFGRDLFQSSIDYIESWWDFASLRPQEYKITQKLQRGTLLYFRPMTRGGLPLLDDIFNVDFHHVIGWHEHCNNFQIVDVPGDHFSMLPSRTYANLPFWRTVFKSFVEWHHGEGSILHRRLLSILPGKAKGKGKKNKKKIVSTESHQGQGKGVIGTDGKVTEMFDADTAIGGRFAAVLGCFPVAEPLLKKLKKKKKKKKKGGAPELELAQGGNNNGEASTSGTSSSSRDSGESDFEEFGGESDEALRWLKQKMYDSRVSRDDQKLLWQFLATIDRRAVAELIDELRATDQVLSIETLTSLPERAQEILAEAMGISTASIGRMAKLSNNSSTLRIVIKSFLKTRKKKK